MRTKANQERMASKSEVRNAFLLPKRFLLRTFSRLHKGQGPYISLTLAYSIGLISYYALYGRLFQFLPALFFLLSIPVVALLGSMRDMTKYWVPFIILLLSYEALQGTVGSFAASKNVFSFYQIDRLIWGFNLTGWTQSTFLSAGLTQSTLLFYNLHFPLVVMTSTLLWYSNRRVFSRYVTAMILTSYTALVTFIILPTAPPWYIGAATNAVQSVNSAPITQTFMSLFSAIESDKFAAFPSLHAAYAIIFFFFTVKLNRWLGLISFPVMIGILFSTIYLGQHYFIDLVAGAAYALIPCLISERVKLLH